MGLRGATLAGSNLATLASMARTPLMWSPRPAVHLDLRNACEGAFPCQPVRVRLPLLRFGDAAHEVRFVPGFGGFKVRHLIAAMSSGVTCKR